MKYFLYFIGFIALLFVLVKHLIPAILQWQQNEHLHQREMLRSIYIQEVEKPSANEKSTTKKVIDFCSGVLTELTNRLMGKMIGGI